MLKPLHDFVVLQVEKAEKKTASGIILSSDQKEQPSIAQVVAVGPGRMGEKEIIPMTVSVGDKVVFKKYSATEFKLSDVEYLVIAEKDILAIVE